MRRAEGIIHAKVAVIKEKKLSFLPRIKWHIYASNFRNLPPKSRWQSAIFGSKAGEDTCKEDNWTVSSPIWTRCSCPIRRLLVSVTPLVNKVLITVRTAHAKDLPAPYVTLCHTCRNKSTVAQQQQQQHEEGTTTSTTKQQQPYWLRYIQLCMKTATCCTNDQFL